jgi:hypothetical protein
MDKKMTKDDFLHLRNICYCKSKQQTGVGYRHKNDALNIQMWTLEKKDSIFSHKKKKIYLDPHLPWVFKSYGNLMSCLSGEMM